MTTGTRIGIPGTVKARMNAHLCLDGKTILLTFVRLAAEIPVAEVWRWQPGGAPIPIGQSEPLGKDDSAAAIALPNGDVILIVSEADPGETGMTTDLRYYVFPNAAPPDRLRAFFAALRDLAAKFA